MKRMQIQHLLSRQLIILAFSLIVTPVFMFAENANKPNVVMIVIDDLGWKDLGCYGSYFYETPNIDRLASEGILFNQAYAGASNCAPSRACLMTGQNTPRHGIYTVSPSDRGNIKTRKLIPTPNTDFVHEDVLTLADEMRLNGYITCQIGKWHIGEDPLQQGFDRTVAGGRWGHPKSYFAPYVYPTLEAPEGEYLTERLTKEAIHFIEENRSNPFFLYLPYYTVHTPLQGKQELIEKYKNKAAKDEQSNAVYAAMVEAMDANAGRLLNKLKELELEDNTIVLFTSDNGGLRHVSSQAPLRGGKGSYYEGGIRVPLIIKWPAHIPAGKTSDEAVVNLDFYPTLLDLLGATPEKKLLDGTSIASYLLKQKPIPEHPLFWHFPIYLQTQGQVSSTQGWRDNLFRTRPGSALRLGKWKLLEFFEDNAIELYDLEADPGETHDLTSEDPETAHKLHQLLKEWRIKTNAPVPSELNPAYDEAESKKLSLLKQQGKSN